jgi:epoxyqueuosine reductase
MTTSTSEAAKNLIRSWSETAGFDVCGFASATAPWPQTARLAEFIEEGRHGSMAWLETTAARRGHPTAMWPAARTAIMLGMNYGPDSDPLEALERRSHGAISVYAQGRDYHDLIKGRLKGLAGEIARRLDAEVKVFVDTAPLMEKPLAERAGIGWQGKHTNLVSRRFGSWLFLGSVLTTLEIEADEASADHCGACRACLDICPTKAFPAPYQLDARRCISYLTIEHDGPIPVEFRSALGNRIYGCDDCLAVCPWNKFASVAREAGLHARDALRSPPLADLAALDDAAFRALFSASPVKRIGRDRFVRNAAYAIGNSGDSALIPIATRLIEDECEMVREAAAWGLGELSRPTPPPTGASSPRRVPSG